MAYTTGAFTTRDEIIAAIKTMSEANGWTTDAFAPYRGGMKLSHHNAAGVYLHWYSANNVGVDIGSYDATTVKSWGAKYNTIVLHPGTGYDANIVDPALQPGVRACPGGNSRKMGFCADQINAQGSYHIVCDADNLALFVDLGLVGSNNERMFLNIMCLKVDAASGGDIRNIVLASLGATSTYAPAINSFVKHKSSLDGCYYSDTIAALTSSEWRGGFNSIYEGYYHTFTNMIDFDEAILYAGISAVTGNRPLFPALIFKLVSGVYRPVGFIHNAATINGKNMPPASPILTSSGNWRVFNLGDSQYSMAIRVDA